MVGGAPGTETADEPARDGLDAPAASIDGVRLVRWPAEHEVRAEVEAAGVPRILLVAEDAAPPEEWDELEDWLRLPLDPDELRARAGTLRRRARSSARPWFDDDQFLRVADRWIDLPVAPRAVVALLVDRFDELVYTDEIADVYLQHGGSAQESARKTMIVRVRRRVAELGLTLHSVRDAGYLLAWDDETCVTQPSDTRVVSSSGCSVVRAADETSP